MKFRQGFLWLTSYSRSFFNPLAQEDLVLNPAMELNWSELEIVVAGEGGHCVGKGPPSCLVCATAYPSKTPPGRLDSRDLAEDLAEIWQRSGRRRIVALDSPGEEAASVQI